MRDKKDVATKSQRHNEHISIYDMDEFRIEGIEDVRDLEQLVTQLETSVPSLTKRDVGPLVIPMTKVAARQKFGRHGALLAERILFNLLGRCRNSSMNSSDAESDRINYPPPYPNTAIYNRVIIAWGSTRTPEGADRAQRIFDLLVEAGRSNRGRSRSRSGDCTSLGGDSFVYYAKPNRQSYKSLLRAWAVSGAPEGPARAHEVLVEMERLSGLTDLIAGRRSDDPVDLYLEDQEMENGGSSRSGRRAPRYPIDPPDRNTYNAVLAAYSRSFVLQHPHAIQQVRALVERLDWLRDNVDDAEYQLDRWSYHAVLRSYGRYAAYNGAAPGPLHPDIARDIETILRRMLSDPDVVAEIPPISIANDDVFSLSWAYGVAIEAWTKTGPFHRTIPKAHRYVVKLASSAAHPSASNTKSSMVINPDVSSRNDGDIEKDLVEEIPIPKGGVYPTQESIMKVIVGWEKSGLPNSQDRIDELVNYAVDAPFDRIFHVNQAAESWIRSGWAHAPELAEKMLERAWDRSDLIRRIQLKPTGQTFAIAMKAWLRSEKPEAPLRAELLFRKMRQLYEDTDDRYYRPRDEHIRFAMTAWILRCKEGVRYPGLDDGGDRLLYPAEHVEAFLHTVRGADWMKNTVGHYSMAIRAWAIQIFGEEDCGGAGTDEIPNPVRRASTLIRQLAEIEEEQPSAYACNWMLETCSRHPKTVEERKEAYDAAINTFRLGRHNPRTFVLVVQVFKAHVGRELDDRHVEVIEELFQECCSRGMLTQDMIWHVVEVVSAETLQKLFGLSYQYAALIVQSRNQQLNIGGRLGWASNDPPSGLLVRNLPIEWSRNSKLDKSTTEDGP